MEESLFETIRDDFLDNFKLNKLFKKYSLEGAEKPPTIKDDLLEEAEEIISMVNWKSLPAGGYEKARLWLSNYATWKDLVKPTKEEKDDWIAKQADEAYSALTGISEEG